eukprot:Skav226247  [mRNA]  locus=scaffold1218:634975:644970:- [translate_table: standard]
MLVRGFAATTILRSNLCCGRNRLFAAGRAKFPPIGWQVCQSEQYGRPYYWNPQTGRTQWEFPEAEAVHLPPDWQAVFSEAGEVPGHVVVDLSLQSIDVTKKTLQNSSGQWHPGQCSPDLARHPAQRPLAVLASTRVKQQHGLQCLLCAASQGSGQLQREMMMDDDL